MTAAAAAAPAPAPAPARIGPADALGWSLLPELLVALRTEEVGRDPFAGELPDGGRPQAALIRQLVDQRRAALLLAALPGADDGGGAGGGGIVGMIVACHRPPVEASTAPIVVGSISHLYVRPRARRRGVGRALMDAGLAALAAQGCAAADLAVQVGNDSARALYARTGWLPAYEYLRFTFKVD